MLLGIDHHLEKVKQDAEAFTSGSDDMSSDDTDFNPDALEALSAKVKLSNYLSLTNLGTGKFVTKNQFLLN